MSSLTVKSDPAGRYPQTPPGPRGHWLFGTSGEWQRDPLAYLAALTRDYGDAVCFRFFLHWSGYLFSHPKYNEHILRDNNQNYTKIPHPTFLLLRSLLGRGLLTNDGRSWLHQRRLIQPIFHRQRIAQFGQIMSEAADSMVDRWTGAARSGHALDLDQEMHQLTLKIVAKCLFSIDITSEAEAIGRELTAVNKQLSDLNRRPFSAYMIRLPFLPKTRRLYRSIHALNEVVEQIIRQRRQSDNDNGDLLSMLMAARDEDSGIGMDDRQLRDEVMTLLLAGHETTANAMSWTFFLLSEHPAVAEKLTAELAKVLAGRLPTIDDLPDLEYTRMVIEESLRLFPPAYGIVRSAAGEDVVGDYRVPAGAVVTLSPYLTHRKPEFWPEPERFDPERFKPEAAESRPRYAYIPFGGGPRQCIGNTFAMTEAQLLLVTIWQRYHPRLLPGHPVEPEPLITLRPRFGLPMILYPVQ